MTYADEQFSLVDECNCTAVSFDSTRLGNPLVAQSLEFDRWFDTPRNSKNFSYIQIEFVPIQIIFYSFTLFYDYKNCLILMYNFVYMYIVSYFIHKNNKSSRIFLQSRHASNSKNHLSLSRFPRRTIHPSASRCHSHYTPPQMPPDAASPLGNSPRGVCTSGSRIAIAVNEVLTVSQRE